MVEEGGCEGIIWNPPPPVRLFFPEPAAQYSSVPVRCTRCRRPNVLCSSGASLVQPGGHRPSLSRFSLSHPGICPALPCTGAARLRQKSRVAVVLYVEKTGPCFIGRIRRQQKRQKRTFLPAVLAGRQGPGCLHAPPQGKTRWCRPSRPNMQAPRCSCSRHALAAVPQPFCSSCSCLSSNTTRCAARSLS